MPAYLLTYLPAWLAGYLVLELYFTTTIEKFLVLHFPSTNLMDHQVAAWFSKINEQTNEYGIGWESEPARLDWTGLDWKDRRRAKVVMAGDKIDERKKLGKCPYSVLIDEREEEENLEK